MLRRSENKQIDIDDYSSEVREVLVKLYWSRRNPNQDCPQDFLNKYAPLPYGQRLTARVSPLKRQAGIASNLSRENQICLITTTSKDGG